MGRKSKVIEIVAKYGKPIDLILKELYAQGDMRFVANTLDVGIATIASWFKLYGIKAHHREAITKQIGESQLKLFLDSFLEAKTVGGKTKDTIDFYRANLGRFLWWLQEQGIPATMANFNPTYIRKFLYYVQTNKVRFGGKSTTSRRPVKRATIDAYWRSFQSFAKWLVKEGVIEEKDNPILKVERPRQEKKVVPEIPGDILQAIEKSLKDGQFFNTRNRAMLLILLDTGIRLKELLELRIPNVNLVDGILKVFGKGQKERLVRIAPFTVKALGDYLAVRPVDSNVLWLKENGEPVTQSALQSFMRRLNQKYPDVHISTHVFRHTFAIRYLRAGGDPFTLQMLGGWEDLDMPRQYAAALKQEDAFKVHEKASPVQSLFGGKIES